MHMLSALMSVYNGENYIEETIKSVLSQTYEEFDFIIVDDGSTDKTVEIITSFDDQRIKLYRLEQNKGVGFALNFGLEKVTSPYLAKVDADDLYYPERFNEQLNFLQQNSEIAVVDSLLKYFPSDDCVSKSQRYKYLSEIHEPQINQIKTPNDISEKLYWFCCITHSLIMGRTEIIKSVGYNKNLSLGEDYTLFYMMNKKGYKFSRLDQVLGEIRVSNKSITANEETLHTFLKIKEEEFTQFLSKSLEGYKYLIWGTGALGKEVLKRLEDVQFNNIHGFIDSNQQKWGIDFQGYPIFSPKIINKDKYKIIVASTVGKFEIANILREAKYKHLDDFFVIA